MRNLLFAVVAGLLAVGCRSDARKGPEPVYPVSGVVTFHGKPLAGADLTFYNAEKNRSAFGRTDDKGQYRLTTFASNDGAVAGTHTVTITKLVVTEGPAVASDTSTEYVPPGYGPPPPPAKPKSELPESYGDRTTSALTATVKSEGPNKIDFDLKD